MELHTEKNGTELTIRLSGELNTLSAPDLSALLEAEMPGMTLVTFDFEKCNYVSSAGLRILLDVYKKLKAAKGRMVLTHVGEVISEALENTGLDAVFDIE